ncbi:hypothetical protein DFH09DRAFT_1171911 [Mycena vulgaris]|nr:hypothetical protein DFH09DRAFT_1171911 [Mycena vulgaris]
MEKQLTRQLASKLAQLLALDASSFRPIPLRELASVTDSVHGIIATLAPCGSTSERRDSVIGAFCAEFLPSLAMAYKRTPRWDGPYSMMLDHVLASPYFTKFIRRDSSASNVYAIYVDELLVSTTQKRKRLITEAELHFAMISLLRLTIYSRKYKWNVDPISNVTYGRLRARLNAIHRVSSKVCDAKESNHGSTGHTGTLHCLKAQDVAICGSRKWKYNQTPAREVKTTTRYACAGCATVSYCCKTHQRLDWPRHRARCFVTVY